MTLRSAAMAAALFILPASPGMSVDAVMGRYDASQSSYTPEKLALPLALKWEYTGNKFENNPAAPVVAGKMCYFACGESIYAVDLDTGSLKWKYPSERGLGGSIRGTPAIYEGSVFFGATDMNLYCLDAATGAFKWAYPVRGAIRSSLCVVDGIIYFGADDDSVYAIDAKSGESVWSKPFTARDDISVGVAVGGGMLIAASMDGNVYGVSATTGKLRTMPFRLPQAPTGTSPVIVGNVAVMAVGNSMIGLALRGNQFRWQVTLPAEAAATPAVLGSDVFVPCRDKKIYAYNVGGRNPVMKWTQPADLGGIPMSSPTVAGETLFATGSKGVIAAFSTTDGSLKWRYVCAPSAFTAAGSPFVDAASSPTVANGALLVVTDDGVLHCFTPDAPDSEPPSVFSLAPAKGAVMSGVPPIKMSCVLYDIGSGVDYSTASMSLGPNPVDYKVDPSTFTINYVTEIGEPGKPMNKLADGVQTITVTARDYKGNVLKYSWFFYVDNRLPPPKRVAPAEEAVKKKTTEPSRRRPAYPSRPTSPVPPGLETPPPPPPLPAPVPGVGD